MNTAKAETMKKRFTISFLAAIFVHHIAYRADAKGQMDQLVKPDMSTVASGPRPDYPYEARRQRITGSGIVIMEIDRATGKVTEARMLLSTGSAILDDAALYAFRRWQFKAGTPGPIKVPIAFTTGGPPVFEYRVKQKPMDEVLARFLGKGVVLKGPIPAYPRFPPWTEKHGLGVYELHVQKDGTVAEVKMLKPSGDSKFDRVALDTLRKWRLRRGPLILELPLSFKLTPTSYSVDIPRRH
jgi:TonB family protein